MLYESIAKCDELITDKFTINWTNKLIISGPCTFSSYEELFNIAKELKKRNIDYIRVGAYKMRTSPYSFQGLRDKGMEIALRVKKELGIKIVIEFCSIEQIEKYGDLVDIIQIGTRNMFKYELLKAAGKVRTPILLKRSFAASYHEWLLSAEYIIKEGNKNVILCERGIRNLLSNDIRNLLDIQAIIYIKKNTNFRIIVDPSHASGNSYMVVPLSKASLIAGCDGLLIESHINPSESLCDSNQTITLEQLDEIMEFRERMKKYEN